MSTGIAQLRWHGDQFKQYTAEAAAKGLNRVWVELQAIARKKASIQNIGTRVKRRELDRVAARQLGTRKRGLLQIEGGWFWFDRDVDQKTQVTVYARSSLPGESPRRRTGFGQKNIVGGRDGLVARVGYTRAARYMTFHELGIRYPTHGRNKGRGRIQRRPTIVPALKDNIARLRSLMATGMRSHRPPRNLGAPYHGGLARFKRQRAEVTIQRAVQKAHRRGGVGFGGG
jgi:hypothetical protein